MMRLPVPLAALLLLLLGYLFFRHGIAPLTGAITGIHAPLPSSLVLLYSGMLAIAILLFHSVREEAWRAFIGQITRFARGGAPLAPAAATVRRGVLVALPLLLGLGAYRGAREQAEAPADPPGIHFSLPGRYVNLTNPFGPYDQWKAPDIHAGGVLYTRNCAMCHGDAQDGRGLFARAWQPRPANFRDEGTIAQLPENYLFWRIKEGGPGLPRGSIEYRSVMPPWDGVLNDEDIWRVIMFEYVNAGKKPARRE